MRASLAVQLETVLLFLLVPIALSHWSPAKTSSDSAESLESSVSGLRHFLHQCHYLFIIISVCVCLCSALIPSKPKKNKVCAAYYTKQKHIALVEHCWHCRLIEDTLNRSEQVNIGNGTEKINGKKREGELGASKRRKRGNRRSVARQWASNQISPLEQCR